MVIELEQPSASRLGEVIDILRSWQRENAPIQLHPGDLGWAWRSGADQLGAALRLWSWHGDIVAIGLLDGPEVLRTTVAPAMWRSDELARRVVADVSDPDRGVLPSGSAAIEAPDGSRVKELLRAHGWSEGESWTPLRLDLGSPDPRPPLPLQVEVVASTDQLSECTAVHRSAWGNPQFTDERWQIMAAGPAFAEARCLLARDSAGVAVATLTVWSSGPGRPALIEPLGVHADHRHRGYGTLICRAAATRLREMGSTSVQVCTPSSLPNAIATYESAGFVRLPPRLDLHREQADEAARFGEGPGRFDV